MSKILGIIPARGGSKRLPGKNLKPLNGIPLIDYTIQAAITSQVFDEILVDSDATSILEHCKSYPVSTHKRPESLGEDAVKVIDVVKHLLFQAKYSQFDAVCLMLPTCPLRLSKHIQEGNQLLDRDIDSVVSFTEFEFPHSLAVTINNDSTVEHVYNPAPLVTGNTRSQDHPATYRPNGAFYAAWCDRFENMNNFFDGKAKGYLMPRLHSADIDTQDDFDYAEWLLQAKKVQID